MKNAGKKVSCRILSCKKVVSIQKGKKSVTVTGKKAGKAKLQIKTGNTKLNCWITVKKSKDSSAATGAQIVVKSDQYSVAYQLNNSQAAKELYAQLPLTLKVENYSDNEKIFYPPKELKNISFIRRSKLP